MDISIIGLGYMGLPMAALAAKAGHMVRGVDVQPRVVASINNGLPHFEEKGLNALVAEQVAAGRLQAFDTPQPSDFHVIAVPTPFMEETKAPDMAYVRQAAASLAPILREGDVVILESTSPVGATEQDVKAVIEAAKPELTGEVLYAFCPERAIPGDTLRELVENDRCVGGLSAEATAKALEFYRTFIQGELVETSAPVAELVKLVENTSRDVQIAFANELGYVCENYGLNVYEVIQLANRHPRVNILRPGTGVGGHCIAVDPWFIINDAKEKTPLMQTTRKINDGKPLHVIARIQELAAQNPTAKIALMGLAFKPDVDDLRTSPAMKVALAVQETVAAEQLLFCEPHLPAEHSHLPLTSLANAMGQADILVFLTAHSVFKELETKLKGKTVYDPAGTFDGRV